ncbi:uncharacterized protein TM35_000991050, partial [Trypanosoma theileri]
MSSSYQFFPGLLDEQEILPNGFSGNRQPTSGRQNFVRNNSTYSNISKVEYYPVNIDKMDTGPSNQEEQEQPSEGKRQRRLRRRQQQQEQQEEEEKEENSSSSPLTSSYDSKFPPFRQQNVSGKDRRNVGTGRSQMQDERGFSHLTNNNNNNNNNN